MMRHRRTSQARAALAAASGRSVPYILSTPAVARDNHTIALDGWNLVAFRANPVFLWCHDSSEPPIGRITDVAVSDGALRGSVTYADAETYPFADTIFRLVKGNFLNAVSVSWDPLKWDYSKDRNRPGGIDFTEVELREVSQVPVPCDTGAIATARARGLDTGPLFDWAGRALDLGAAAPLPRPQLEALRRSSQTAAQARRVVSVFDMMRADTRADRQRIVRYVAYQNAREFGFVIPPRFLPPQDREERAAIARGCQIQATG
jgi:HK97 family phage prohead protease